ncbi:hypothetical protein [Streptomyces sp. MOE7]|nr:hypothetical protein [Streptomyces sp. MOE7]
MPANPGGVLLALTTFAGPLGNAGVLPTHLEGSDRCRGAPGHCGWIP